MPWYYAGPDAKPIGPISLEELHSRRVSGAVSLDTYIIEHTGQSDETRAWKHYRDVFPASPSLPPLPVGATTNIPPSLTVKPHPLFPSAAPVPQTVVPPTGTHPAVHLPAQSTTNPWCLWGFWLGLGSLVLLVFTCGLTSFVAIPAFFVSLAGMLQVQHSAKQSGRRFALLGLLFSSLAIVITIIVLAVAIPYLIKERQQTTTEQSTNDSE